MFKMLLFSNIVKIYDMLKNISIKVYIKIGLNQKKQIKIIDLQ